MADSASFFEPIAAELRRIGDLLETLAKPAHPPPPAKPPPAAAIELDAAAQRRFDALRAWRLEQARLERVPPYIVASDRTLRVAARDRPTHLEALRRVPGFGPARTARHGAAVLEVLARS